MAIVFGALYYKIFSRSGGKATKGAVPAAAKGAVPVVGGKAVPAVVALPRAFSGGDVSLEVKTHDPEV